MMHLPGGAINAGIGQNVVAVRSPIMRDLPLVNRLDRDVFSVRGVRVLVILEGINDIRYSPAGPSIVPTLETGLANVARSAHAHGLRVVACTLLPFRRDGGWTPAREAEREQVNHWLASSGLFDRVLNTTSAMAAPGQPLMLDARWDSGDGIHPNPRGERHLAAFVSSRLAFFMRDLASSAH